ncbi:BgTH12-05613 [Blumeria graminis f. sp. triticale]|uniref:BgTH12-05613 n=1 Tax=Blumeria graminis f. sp. triticale TaxID=1689686 RepID=A0A9W4D4C8_BLUGR|nr:BgTH12-05613 [Blumeria graminis f. sp. triticale]
MQEISALTIFSLFLVLSHIPASYNEPHTAVRNSSRGVTQMISK